MIYKLDFILIYFCSQPFTSNSTRFENKLFLFFSYNIILLVAKENLNTFFSLL